MELPVTFDPLVTGLSILLAAGIAGYAFRKPIAAAFKRRHGFDLSDEDYIQMARLDGVRIVVERVGNVSCTTIEARPSTLESAQARLAEIRAEKASSAAKPVSANEGGQP